MTAGVEPDEQDVEAGGEAPAQSTEPADEAASREGRRTRRRLSRLLEEEQVITGDMELMVASDQSSATHRLVLHGQHLTPNGGPARQVLDLVSRIHSALQSIVPNADPWLASVAGANSIEVRFNAPPEEVEEASRRRASDDDKTEPGEALPDTTLGLVTLAHVFEIEDPDEAVEFMRRVGAGATDHIKGLAVELVNEDAELDLSEVRPGSRATRQRAREVVERLDADEEIRPELVSVLGVLQGANSAGEGLFVLVPDSSQDLDPALGRRRPGSPLRGKLTPDARRQIRDQGLWDRHVHARIRVIRSRRGGRVRVEELRLVSVTPRF
jgi:hypothetical protein